MDVLDLKRKIGSQISLYRKQAGLTQAELAEKLNYSDKAISKWERGESVPDLITMIQLAELFGVDLDTLAGRKDGKCPAGVLLPEKPARPDKPKANRRVILMLCSILVWFVALLAFVILSSSGIGKSWVGFFYAVPVNAIVLLSLRSAWHDFKWNRVLISVIMWGSVGAIHITLLLFLHANIWKLYLLGIPGQAAIILWFRMFRPGVREEKHG